MALRPLHDTAAVGLSLLDMTVHARVDAAGVLPRTRTRIVYVFTHNGEAEAVVGLHRSFLADTDAEATGLLVVQPGAGLHVLETGPDTVAGLMRALAAEARAGQAAGDAPASSGAAPAHGLRSDLGAPGVACGRVSSVRVIGMTEDVPTPAFGPWASRALAASLPTGDASGESEPVVVQASKLVRALVAMGQAIQQRVRDANSAAAEAGHDAPDCSGFIDQALAAAGCAVPSSERCAVWAACSGIPDVEEWLELFDTPAAALPLSASTQPRLLY